MDLFKVISLVEVSWVDIISLKNYFKEPGPVGMDLYQNYLHFYYTEPYGKKTKNLLQTLSRTDFVYFVF